MILHGNNDRLDISEENVSKLEDIATETTQGKTEREKWYTLKNKQNIIEQCDSFKWPKMCIIETLKDEGNFENIMVK